MDPNRGPNTTYSVYVSVVGVAVVYGDAQFQYDGPRVTRVAPARLAPVPNDPTGPNLTLSGINFGYVPGAVTVGPRTLDCPTWADASIVCHAPVGVEAAMRVVVHAASGLSSLASGPALGPGVDQVRFSGPAVVAVRCAGTGNCTASANDTGPGLGTGRSQHGPWCEQNRSLPGILRAG